METLVYAALDTHDVETVRKLTSTLANQPRVGLKLGLEAFTALGPPAVRDITKAGAPVFLDLKFHDIPNTVAAAVRAAAKLNVDILNVHAAGGPDMMRAAAAAATEGAQAAGVKRPAVIAVTILTSMDDADLTAVGYKPPASDNVVRLATLARECGLDGVVCSAHEIGRVRAACGPDFLLIVPGIRPVGSALGDQKRVMTPREAIRAGASALVVGRPITSAAYPAKAATEIVKEALGY